jgi:hypothetical protein
LIDDATAFRSKEQVLCDLARALNFTPEALQENRAGRLSKEQVKALAQRCAKPASIAVVFAWAPFIIWSHMLAASEQIPFGAGVTLLMHQLSHAKDLFDAHGKWGGAMMLASFLISLGLAVIVASRVPISLYFDLLERKVISMEGRVIAREQQTLRPNGRDPIEKYLFSLRHVDMPVNLAAYRALENGSIYLVYLLPRSEELVSIEPKVD